MNQPPQELVIDPAVAYHGRRIVRDQGLAQAVSEAAARAAWDLQQSGRVPALVEVTIRVHPGVVIAQG